MLNENQHVSWLSWQPIATVGTRVTSRTEQPFAGNRRRGGWEVSPIYVSENRPRSTLGLSRSHLQRACRHWRKEAQPFNLSCCRVIGSAVFAFIVFNNVLLWLLKGVGMDVNCLSNSGQEGGEDATWAGMQTQTDHVIARTVECFVLGAVQTDRLASHQCLLCRRPSVTHAGHSGLHYHCLPLLLPRLPWRWHLLRRWLAADVQDNAYQMLVVWAAHEHR